MGTPATLSPHVWWRAGEDTRETYTNTATT